MADFAPFLRNGTYYIRRRVPRRYQDVESRSIVQFSLWTDSLKLARAKAPSIWDSMLDAWEVKLQGKGSEGEARLDAARELARQRKIRYMDVEDVARLPIEDILARLNAAVDRTGKIDTQEADAALGLPPTSRIKVSEVVDAFYEIADDRMRGKNEDQLRRHRNPRIKATTNFIEAVGDKALADVTREDLFTFKKWWMPKVKDGSVKAESANKDFSHLRAMMRAVAEARGLSIDLEANGLLFQDVLGQDETRPPFSVDWIKEKLLAPGALGGLNTDARLIVLGMINTGYRPGEGAGLMPEEIVLEANIPHIIIKPNDNRSIKNKQSRRTLPLTGVSLEAFRQARSGFPRYSTNSATLSATVNKYLSENGLLETPEHSLYGLRHSLEDRMLRADVPDRVRMDVLGHQIKRERYGEGGGLQFVHEQLLKVAI